MSYSNENSPATMSLEIGTRTSDIDLPLMKLPKRTVLTDVRLLNAANIDLGTPANHLRLSLKADGEEVGYLDTQDGAITAFESAPFVLTEPDLVAGSNLSLTADETEGLPEITKITCLAAAGLDLKSFLIYDEDGSVGVWIDEDGGATIPAGANGADRALELALVGDEDAEGVATALAALLNGDSKFSAVVDPEDAESVLVTASLVGTRTDAADAAGGEATGFDFEVVQQGAAGTAVQLTDAKLSIEHFVP